MSNKLDEETAETIAQMRSWLRDLDRVTEGTSYSDSPSCYCCEDDSDPVSEFMPRGIVKKLQSVHDWALSARKVVAAGLWQIVRMDVGGPTFYGGCDMDHEGVHDGAPGESLDRLFDQWCTWIGAFWIGQRPDAYWHSGSLGGTDHLVLRTADGTMRFDMRRESFQDYKYPDERPARSYTFTRDEGAVDFDGNMLVPKYPEEAVELAEVLARTRRWRNDWEIEEFMSEWSGCKLKHYSRYC